MVQDNESEDRIVKTLLDLGVSQEQAHKLLLIAEADTFTLLKNEIEKMAKVAVVEEQKTIISETSKTIDSIVSQKEVELKSALEKSVLEQTLKFQQKQEDFQKSINSSVSKLAQLNEEVYSLSEKNNKAIQTIKKDLDETKLKGIRARQSYTRFFVGAIGVLFFIFAALILVSLMSAPINIDNLTIVVILTLMGTAMVYFSANI